MDLADLRAKGIAVSSAALDTNAMRRDLWPRNTMRMRAGVYPPRPAVVAWPTSHEQVGILLTMARQSGMAVVPYGAGSGVCGAAAGMADALVIDLKRMNRILQVDPASATALVQPGILGQHLEDRLGLHGWMTAHSPSSIMCSTVGGYVAARSAGQFSSRYGVFEDMVLGLRLVTPSGPLSCGVWTPPGEEDLLPVVCGSEGALGVITEVLVRLRPIPAKRWFRGYAFGSLEAAWEAMRQLMQADLWPSVLRLYDPIDTRISGATSRRGSSRSAHQLLSRIQAGLQTPGLRRLTLELPLALPRLLNRISKGLGSDVLLIVGFEGSPEVVEACVEAAGPILASARDLGATPGERWFAHRHDVSYKLAPIFSAGCWADTMEVATHWSRLPQLYAQVCDAIGQHAVVMAHFSHAYREGCSIYFSFAGSGSLEDYDACWQAALAATRSAGGTVTHHHGVGPLKAAAATREQGAAIRVWHEIRSQLDPDGMMNPGRLFPPEVPTEAGPPPPGDGPVFGVDSLSLLAEVDPGAAISDIEDSLAQQGYALRLRPDRPYNQWLRRLERAALDRWCTPVFGVQARFEDGSSVRLGPAPRSAAGPDLRWPLLHRATPELIEVPIQPLGDGQTPFVRCAAQTAQAPDAAFDPEATRPVWRTQTHWGFAGPAATTIASLCDANASFGAAEPLPPDSSPQLPAFPTPDTH